MDLRMMGIPLASSWLPTSIRKVSITATCRLEWNNQLIKKLWRLVYVRLNTMILFPGRHLMGVLECHQLIPPKNCTFFFRAVIINRQNIRACGTPPNIPTEARRLSMFFSERNYALFLRNRYLLVS